MTDLEGRLRAAFGDREVAPATFYAFEHALRFNLGGNRMELSVIERFLTAIDRAREIGRAAFGATRRLAVVVEAWGEGSASRILRRDLARLAWLGLGSFDLASAERTEPQTDHREDFGKPLWRWRWCLETTEVERTLDTVLWLACSREMAIEPRLRGFSFLLIDFDRAVLVNVYDDRGMDVVATEPKEIASLGPRFRNWLLASAGAMAEAASNGQP